MQGVTLLLADRGDAAGTALGELPGLPGRMGTAARRSYDDEAAFAPGLDQHLGRGGPGKLRVPAGSTGHPVQDVQAAAWRGFRVAGDDPPPQVPEVVVGERVTVPRGKTAADRAALQLEHLQAAGHRAADHAEPVVTAVAEPVGDLRRVRPLGLPALPLPGGCLRAVCHCRDDGAAGLGEGQRGVEYLVHVPGRGDCAAVPSWAWPGCHGQNFGSAAASASLAAGGSASHCSAGILGGRVTGAGSARASATAACAAGT